MAKVIKNKRGVELVICSSLGHETSSEKFLYLYIIWLSFSVIPKITSGNLCKLIHGIINYSTSICLFESGKCGKEGKKSQKFEYLKNEKSFLDEIKIIFHSFKGLSFSNKMKIW